MKALPSWALALGLGFTFATSASANWQVTHDEWPEGFETTAMVAGADGAGFWLICFFDDAEPKPSLEIWVAVGVEYDGRANYPTEVPMLIAANGVENQLTGEFTNINGQLEIVVWEEDEPGLRPALKTIASASGTFSVWHYDAELVFPATGAAQAIERVLADC